MKMAGTSPLPQRFPFRPDKAASPRWDPAQALCQFTMNCDEDVLSRTPLNWNLRDGGRVASNVAETAEK